MDNRTIIEGRIGDIGQTRVTPAGLPITRIRLEHHSTQRDAGLDRRVSLSLTVVCSGEALHRQLTGLAPGAAVRVGGFLAQAGYRHGSELELYAKRIEHMGGDLPNVS